MQPPPPPSLSQPTTMEEAEEKMAALKRAYADIILNTAKESAARILEAEHKALRSQQDLVLAKEEALGTLLRLKSIMESKINEAERGSLGHVKRIQELEIQLTESESTIKHLKVELQRANDELLNVKSKQTEQLDKQISKGYATLLEDAYQQNKLPSTSVLCPPSSGPEKMPISDPRNIALMQRNAGKACGFLFENHVQRGLLGDARSDYNCPSSSDLASIIMRSKELELYRNGCTQRIHALEQNTLTGKVPLGKTGQSSKTELVVCKNKTAEKPCVEGSLQMDNLVIQAKNINGIRDIRQHDEIHESGQVKGSHSLSKRKRRRRFKRRGFTIYSTSQQEMTEHEPSKFYSSTISRIDKVTEHGVEDSLQMDNLMIQAKSSGLKDIILQGEILESGQEERSHRPSMRTRMARINQKLGVTHESGQEERSHGPSMRTRMARINRKLGVIRAGGESFKVHSSMISGNDKMTKHSGIMSMTEIEISQNDLNSHSTPVSNQSCRNSEDRSGHLDLPVKNEKLGSLKCKNAVHGHSVTLESDLNSDYQISVTTLLNVENIGDESIIRAPQSLNKSDINGVVLMVGQEMTEHESSKVQPSLISGNDKMTNHNVQDSLQMDNLMIQANNMDGSKDIIQHGGIRESGQVEKHHGPCMRTRSACLKQKITDHGIDKMTKHSEIMSMAESEISQNGLNSQSIPVFNESCRNSEDRSEHFDLSVKNEKLGLSKCTNAVHSVTLERDIISSDYQISGTTPSNVENVERESITRAPQSLNKSDISDGVLIVGHAENNESHNFIPEKELQPDQKEKENSGASTGRVNLGTEDIPSVNFDPKIEKTGESKTGESSTASAKAGNGKLLKYTFQRTRKRGLGSINENVFPEKKDAVKRRTEDKPSTSPEPQKSILAMESTRDTRRLVQVARQLISLSGKKW